MGEANYDAGPFDVFLCHNSEDKPEVRRIADQLSARGIKPWLDENEIQPGKPWQDILEAQIGTIKAAAVFVGESGIGPWQRMEMRAFINEFVERDCPVIAVILPSATQTPQLPSLLKNLHWVDFRDARPNPLEQLIWGITGHKPDRQVIAETLLDSPLDNVEKLDKAHQEGRRFYSPLGTPPDQTQRIQIQNLLNRVQTHWVDGVLTESLPHKKSIALGKEVRENSIEPPWEYAAPLPNALRKLLLHNRNITTLFDATALLLILGEPGSGKTTTLLELAEGLIVRAKKDPAERVPVVLNLSSWEKTKSLEEWIAAELSVKYGILKSMGGEWIAQDYLVPLLDGLDEVSAAAQSSCVAAINAFIESHKPSGLVVCSRLAEYEWLPKRLKLNGAICIEPLCLEDVNQFLEARGTELVGLSQAMSDDPLLRELSQTPLMLTIMSEACKGVSKEALIANEVNSVQTRQQQIFNFYVEQMFKQKKSPSHPFGKEETIGWLSWLARNMKERSRSVFMVEELQPSWVSSKAQSQALGVLWCMWIGGGIGGGFTVATGHVLWLILGFLVGLMFGWRDEPKDDIDRVETMRWQWREFWKSMFGSSLAALCIGSIHALGCNQTLVNFFTPVPCGEQWNWMLVYLPFMLMGAIINGLSVADMNSKVSPNQGIILSLKNSLITFLLMVLTFGLIAGLFGWLSGNLTGGLQSGLGFGLIAGFIGGLNRGGLSVMKHYNLRLILAWTRSTPYRFIPFLDHCAQLIFLKKVGGGYIFIHRTLLEYFAELPSQTSRTSYREKS